MSRISIALVLAAALLCACGTTSFNSTWKDPSVRTGGLRGKTVAAVFVSHDLGLKRSAEVYVANDLTNRGAKGLTAYTLLPDNRGDGEAARTALTAAGVDGVVVMRVVSKDQKGTYKPGATAPAYYGGFAAFYSYAYGQIYTPTSVAKDAVVSLETVIYSLADDKPLWASLSHTTNPDNLPTLIDDTIDSIAKQVAK
jgi:hypothetical protein